MTPPFSVHVDQDDLTKQDFAAALTGPATAGHRGAANGRSAGAASGETGHHGARDARQTSRSRSERDHARVGGGGKSRSYAFRRS